MPLAQCFIALIIAQFSNIALMVYLSQYDSDKKDKYIN